MLAKLIEFATHHYLLVTAFAVLLAMLILHELRRGGKAISALELTRLVNGDAAVLVDVRPTKEYAAGHITGALNIPESAFKDRQSELAKYKDKTLIIVDALGQHAPGVCRDLQKQGYSTARLSGGISSWRADNLPLVK